MRTLLSATAIVLATFATASCAPSRTAFAPSIPAPAVAASSEAKPIEVALVPPVAAPIPSVQVHDSAPAETAPSADTDSPGPSAAPAVPPSVLFGMRLVALHNMVREAAGVEPIRWDSTLAADARNYAEEMAKTGRWAHSAMAERPGEGENLWMGTRGAFSLSEMVGAWAHEGRMFRAGAFPEVSKTGNWDDVGHYTQMIWPGSIRVGCAVRSSARFDYLVCRYSPAGNVMGSTALASASMNRASLKFARGPVTSNSSLD